MSDGIVSVKEVRYDPKQTEAACENEELVFFTKFVEYLLLEGLTLRLVCLVNSMDISSSPAATILSRAPSHLQASQLEGGWWRREARPPKQITRHGVTFQFTNPSVTLETLCPLFHHVSFLQVTFRFDALD